MDIGDIIKKFRTEKGLTQKKLAEMTGLAEITIRQYEAKKYVPKQAQLQKICEALDIDDSNPMVFANSINFNKTLTENEMKNWNNERLDYFSSWLAANDIYYNKTCSKDKEGYSFYFDNSNYFLNLEQIKLLSPLGIELVKTLIKALSVCNTTENNTNS